MTNKIFNQIKNDRKFRKNLAFRSHYYFFHIYLSHYAKFKTAPFQREMFNLTQNPDIKNLVIVAFRGSSKSTITALSYVIWSMIGKPGKKFIVILSQTQQQARLILANIRKVLETSELLISDFGPFDQEGDEWSARSIVISKYQTRITAISSGESIRGLRHHETRPDLIIADDVEDLESVKTRESRDKTFDWLTGDVIPAGDKSTKLVVVGNLLHEDSLIMRLKKQILEGNFDGVFKEYPLLDKKTGEILWPGKFPDMDSIKQLRKRVPSEAAWQREYLLNMISDQERVVQRKWIQTYKKLAKEGETAEYLYTVTSVDPAISQKTYSSYTAIITAEVWRINEEVVIFILPNSINKRLNFPKAVDNLKMIYETRLKEGKPTEIIIESVGAFQSLAQQLIDEGCLAKSKNIKGDKRQRLSLTTPWIQKGKVLFPEIGAEKLVEQITGFGIENYDDLADAFSLLVLHVIEKAGGKKEDDPGAVRGPAIFGESPIVDLKSLGGIRTVDIDKDF